MTQTHLELPPGPRLPRAVQTVLLWYQAKPFLEWCHRRYGDVFTVRAAPVGTLVYLADPAAIAELYRGDPDVFHAGEGHGVLRVMLGDRSVVVLDGDEHLRQRRRMLPPFHGDSVRRYGEVIRSIVEAEVAGWPTGTPFPVYPRTQAIALEVIMRAVIGVEDPARLARLRELLPALVGVRPIVLLDERWPPLRRVGPWRRFRRLQRDVDEILYDEIARLRADPGLAERGDVLSLLIHGAEEAGEPMSDADLRDQLITLLVVGHETTAASLAFAIDLVLHDRAVLERLRQSIEAGDDSYIDAVIKETLRVRPVVFNVPTLLKAPVELAGRRLPAGVNVSQAILLVQRAARHHPEPTRFRPERFLNGSPPSYSWIPFGGGRRRCLGAAFASFEMKVVLRTLLSLADIEPVHPQPDRMRSRHVTLAPARGVPVRIVRKATTPKGSSPVHGRAAS